MENTEKTIIEWLQYAKARNYSWADAAITNAQKSTDTDLQKNYPSLFLALAHAFDWTFSREGGIYWYKIGTNLMENNL